MGSKFFGNKNDNKNNKNKSSKAKPISSKKNGGSGIKKSGRGK